MVTYGAPAIFHFTVQVIAMRLGKRTIQNTLALCVAMATDCLGMHLACKTINRHHVSFVPSLSHLSSLKNGDFC